MQLINVILGVLLVPRLAWALFGIGDIVFDPTNYAENFVTAMESAKTTLEAIEISQHTLDNIASLEHVVLQEGGYLDDLMGLATEAEALLRDIQHLSDQFAYLFGTETLPINSELYALRRSEVYGYRYQAADTARRVQQLVRTTMRVISRGIRLVHSIPVLIGGKQATLSVLQAQLETVSTLQRSALHQAAMAELQMIEQLDDASATESLRRINEDVWSSWPGLLGSR